MDAYLSSHPGSVVYSDPIPNGNADVAFVGFERNPHDHVVAVVSITNGVPRQIATLALPYPYYDFARDRPIQTADLTGDGAPEVLIRFSAADNDPGVVISGDGGTWRLVPESNKPTDVYIGRDPTIANGRLTSTHNDCSPNCAQGHTTTLTWHYDREHRRLVVG